MKRSGSFISNIGLSVISLIIILMVLESTFRLKALYEDTKRLHVLEDVEHNINNYRGEILLRDIIRLSKYPRIIYELIPNLSVQFYGKSLTTNSHGFRSPQYLKQKRHRTVRIVGLGDSVMFGWRVSDSECYLSLLQENLNRDFPNVSWEVINTAVPGYNTVMEVETLKAKALRFNPDIVITHYVGNDIDLPNFIRKKESYFTLKKSFLLEFIFHRLRGATQPIADPLVPAPHHSFERRFENAPDRVPDEYKDMVGKDAYYRAMKELKALSLEHGFELLIISIQAPKYVKEICSLSNIPQIEAIEKVTQFMDANGIKKYSGSVLTISEDDPHPSAVGHRIMAEFICEYFEKSGLIKKMIRNNE